MVLGAAHTANHTSTHTHIHTSELCSHLAQHVQHDGERDEDAPDRHATPLAHAPPAAADAVMKELLQRGAAQVEGKGDDQPPRVGRALIVRRDEL